MTTTTAKTPTGFVAGPVERYTDEDGEACAFRECWEWDEEGQRWEGFISMVAE